MLNFFDWLRGFSTDGRTAADLYGSIVTQGRDKAFYTTYGVPDVAEKRYEMIVLHLVLVLERLRASGARGKTIAQALTETFVRDLDGSIREMAVGDTKVPAKVRKAAGGLWDRDTLYRQVFSGESAPADGMTLHALLDELLFEGRSGGSSQDHAALMVNYVEASRQQLLHWRLDDGADALRFPQPLAFVGPLADPGDPK